MDSPAKGDNRQCIKASQKHIEFQLQREKAYTRELEDKIKSQQAHIAKLDQDKAELRREMITHTDEEKKRTKLEERCHALQKELAEKQNFLVSEQKRVTSAEYEREQIRRDAHASIAKWCEAEKQWISENEVLQKDLEEVRETLTKLKNDFDLLESNRDDLKRQLQREKDRSLRLETGSEANEKMITSLHSRIEALKNEIHTRDETVFKLDEAGTKWQEICRSKDEEIKTFEIQASKMTDTIEKLQTTISTLNQRIEATKIINMEEKGRVEQISCNLRESEKEKKLLQLELEAVRRDLEHAAQNASKHQELITDLRSKISILAEQMKEKNVEIRKQELTISQLTAEVKRVELEGIDNSYLVNSLESQLQSLRDTLEKAQISLKSVQEEKVILESEIQQVKISYEVKDEAVVLMKSEFEDKIETLITDIKNLESEVTARQDVINSITKQLGDANTRNEELYKQILHNSDTSANLREVFENLQIEKNKLLIEQIILKESISRLELYENFSIEKRDIILTNYTDISLISVKYFGEIRRLNKIVEDLDLKQTTSIIELTKVKNDLEEEVRVLRECESNQVNQIKASNGELALFEEKTKKYEENISTLKKEVELQRINFEELYNTNKMLSDKLCKAEHLFQELLTSYEEQVYLLKFSIKMFDNAIESFDIFCEDYTRYSVQKEDIVFESFKIAYLKEKEKFLDAVNNSEKTIKTLEDKYAHLYAKLSDTEFRFGEREKVFSKQIENLVNKINTADNQKEVAEKAKDNLLQKINSLTEHQLKENNANNEKIREVISCLDSEKRNGQMKEEKLQRLRKNLDYEVQRKKEYKKALEEVKSKREEAERYRATEKDWAMKAINRANEEVNYWVKSFDKLKVMLDELSLKSGARVSAMDQATIKKFEEAKSKLVLHDQSVNTVSNEEENHREKRQRIEL